MTSAMGADGVESSNLGEDVEPEGGMEEIAEGVEDVSENTTTKESEKDGGLLVAFPINETMTISENGGAMGIGFSSNFKADRDSVWEIMAPSKGVHTTWYELPANRGRRLSYGRLLLTQMSLSSLLCNGCASTLERWTVT